MYSQTQRNSPATLLVNALMPSRSSCPGIWSKVYSQAHPAWTMFGNVFQLSTNFKCKIWVTNNKIISIHNNQKEKAQLKANLKSQVVVTVLLLDETEKAIWKWALLLVFSRPVFFLHRSHKSVRGSDWPAGSGHPGRLSTPDNVPVSSLWPAVRVGCQWPSVPRPRCSLCSVLSAGWGAAVFRWIIFFMATLHIVVFLSRKNLVHMYVTCFVFVYRPQRTRSK